MDDGERVPPHVRSSGTILETVAAPLPTVASLRDGHLVH